MSLTREAKHGWEVAGDYDVRRATVLTWERPTDGRPIVAMTERGDIYSFKADGTQGHAHTHTQPISSLTLRDAPAPKASGVVWVKIYDGGTPDVYLHAPKTGVGRGGCIALIEVPWTEGMGLEAESSHE